MPRAVAFLVCGIGAVMIAGGLRLARLGRETRSFTRTAGRVVAAYVDEIPGPAEEGGARFRPVVRYTYEARGRTYESDQVAAGSSPESTTSDRDEARRWVERHAPGSDVDVWFDPRDPSRAVLVRGVASAQAIAAVVLGLALVAVGIFALAR